MPKREQKTSFRLLLELFQSRFLENDTVSPGGGYETNIYQVLGAIATPGLFVSLYLMPALMELGLQKPGPAVDWAIRTERLFFPAYSFAVTGFATVFEWDVLFPDRRDFLILAPFPIRVRELFAAKFAALGYFLLALIAAVNLLPTLTLPIFSTVIPKLGAAGLIRLTLAQFAAPAGAAAFAFFAVATFQGILINVTSPRIFRKLSPFVQMCGMSLMVMALLTFPIYSTLLRRGAQTHQVWLWLFPPVWFTGIYDLLQPGGDPLFADFGRYAIEALGIAIAAFSLTWALGFRRHYRRMLESEDIGKHWRGIGSVGSLIRSPEERAIFDFSGKTLARSTKHRLFLATYLSVGLSIGLLSTIVVGPDTIKLSPDGLRSFPFVIAFFIIIGFARRLSVPGGACVELDIPAHGIELGGNVPQRHAEAGPAGWPGACAAAISSG
jgi:hypothetical protein